MNLLFFQHYSHQKNRLKGKLVATVLTGLVPDALSAVNQALATEWILKFPWL
ncbi:hypothetical protein [Desulfobacter hydrogenophilus]|uniref:hypothetical protein n=1 Tax=Desulfobacter hydrogenophilus TaxID=2291 RepID=UPI0013D7E6E0|nr:hypothetical protein [Desulfobacter hydrogenophilus]NDY74269.1 hypothetical protein [Desulfobacter hydrogenophilus]